MKGSTDMSALTKIESRILRAAEGARSQVRAAKQQGYNAAKVQEIKAKAAETVRMLRDEERTNALAESNRLKAAAKTKYLQSSDATVVAEVSLLRDRAALANERQLLVMAERSDAMPAEAAYVLGAELRRRGMAEAADLLAAKFPPTTDPWETTPEWQAAAEVGAEFRHLDSIVAFKSAATGETDPDGYLMTESGVVGVDAFLSE